METVLAGAKIPRPSAQRISEALFAMADRLERASERSRSENREAWASEPMR